MEGFTNSKELFRQLKHKITLEEEDSEIESILFLLLETRLNISRADILAEKEVMANERSFDEHINRINQHEPVQYILGEAWFYGRPFKVNPSVLIPRPETELLAREVIAYARQSQKSSFVDIGTGSGCLAVTLAVEGPHWNVAATDVSPDALEVAKGNATTYNAPINFLRHDILAQPFDFSNVDIIVSNPPYIAQNERESISKNVVDFEPPLALFVPDSDPLCFYKAIAVKAESMKPNGAVFTEINERFGREVSAIFGEHGFSRTAVIKDIDNKDRIVAAYR